MTALRFLNIFLALCGGMLWLVWMQKHPRWRLYAVPVVLYAAHLLIFYAALFAVEPGYGTDASRLFNTWSSVLRVQELSTIFIGGIVMLRHK